MKYYIGAAQKIQDPSFSTDLLGLIQGFTRIQINIDYLVFEYKQNPLNPIRFPRLKDEYRSKQLGRIGRATGNEELVQGIPEAFNRIKDIRDHICHSPIFIFEEENGTPILKFPYFKFNPRIKRLNNKSSVSLERLKSAHQDMVKVLQAVEGLRVALGQRGGPIPFTEVID